MYLPSRSVAVEPMHPKVALWLTLLAGLMVLNVGQWISLARFAPLRTPYAETQLLLSGVYVAVCAFRSIYPRVDLERVCLWDTWLSAIALGRIVATVAELCFALQCALFVQRLSEIVGMPLLTAAADAFVPLAIVAELACWYAVLSLNHMGHAVEESLWALMMLVLSAAAGTAAIGAHGSLRVMLIAGFVVYAVGASVTMAFDVRMYVRRWRRGVSGRRLTLAAGFDDCWRRRNLTLSWEVWRAEAPWMTLYFSVGVWTSLAMVLLEHAARS